MLIDGYFGGTNRHLFIEISELFFSVQILQLLIQLVQRTLHPLHSARPEYWLLMMPANPTNNKITIKVIIA